MQHIMVAKSYQCKGEKVMIISDVGGRERCVTLGEYIIEHQATVRATAQVFGVSKSTVHKDVTEVLKSINKGLWQEVQVVLNKNKQERHLRGGEATKQKYLEQGKSTQVNA